MFGFISLFAFRIVFNYVEFMFCFRIFYMCYFFLVDVLCLWDGFTFIYRFRFIFLTDSVRSGIECETQFEFH